MQSEEFLKPIIKRLNPKYLTQKEKEMLKKFNVDKKNKSKSKKDKSLEIKKEQKRKNKNEKSLEMKKGRKMKNREITQDINEKNNSNEKVQNVHGKYSSDNIIQKLKNIFINNLLKYSSVYFNKYKLNIEEKIRLKKIEYNGFNNNLNKDINIRLLDSPLSTILSYKNSSKCKSNKNFDHNEKIIAKIFEKEANNAIIMKFLNMTFNDWINIFTHKKNIEHDIEFNGLQLEIMNENKDEDDYLTRFVFYLYNFKNWFQNKKGRKKRKTMKMI
jgi:hypothetical protein